MHGKGHDPRASCVSFLLSTNAGQPTGLRGFLSSEAPEGSDYCYVGKMIQPLCVHACGKTTCAPFEEVRTKVSFQLLLPMLIGSESSKLEVVKKD